MEVTSTLRTEHTQTATGRPFSTGDTMSAGRLDPLADITGRVIRYFLQLIREKLSPAPMAWPSVKASTSSISYASQPSVPAELAGQTRVRSTGEPPDPHRSDSDPELPPHFSQQALTTFFQHPMNEQLLRSESPHKASVWAIQNRSSGSVSARKRPSGEAGLPRQTASPASAAHFGLIPMLKWGYAACMLFLFWFVASSVQAQAPTTVDLSVHKSVSNQTPSIGDVLTYTVVVTNGIGSTVATNITIKDELPAGGVSYVPSSASTIRGAGTFTSTTSATSITGTWTISAIAPGDSAVLVLRATVLERGVWFNTAEVMSADQPDIDSQQNNQNLREDDYDAVCFSVPILYYKGDEYTVSIPSGYDQVTWYRDDVPVSTTSVSPALAEVNPDFSLTIKSPGVYRFVLTLNGCPSTNCCNIDVIQGPLGSLGDYVFVDTNQNGIQDDGNTGLDGVTVYLYDQTGTTKLDSTITVGGGSYLFDSLASGGYTIQFVSPAGYQSTSANTAGVADDLDSDAGVNGFTGIYTIDTTQPESSTARNNLTADAGYFVPGAAVGDFVYNDLNGNGVADPGEPGLAGVTVSLYQNGSAVTSVLTDATGLYSFTGLTPGSSLTYSVGFTAPAGYTATTPLSGTSNQLVSFTLGAGEYNQTQDAGFRLVPVAPVYDLALAKNVVGSGPFLPGSQVNFVLTMTNKSTAPVYNITINDLLPAGLSFVSGTGFAVSGANSVSALVAGPISASGSMSLTVVAAISPGYSSPMATNQAVISGFTATTDAAGPIPVDTNPADNTATVSIPVGSLAAVGDFVYNDLNGNGVADPGEPGLAGVTVSLYQNGSAVTSVLTDATGLYSFTGLTPGSSLTYSVGFTAPAGYTATTPLSGTSNQLVSFTLGAGEYNQTQDAGFRLVPVAPVYDLALAKNVVGSGPFLPGSQASYVLTVTNNSTVPVYNVRVDDVLPAGLSFVSGTGFAVSGANSVSASVAGPISASGGVVSLSLVVAISPGYSSPMATNQGLISAFTATPDPAGAIPVDIRPANNTATVGIPIGSLAAVGDFVYNDLNGNGVADPGEPGLAGVTVSLYQNGSAVTSVLTDATGLYSFTGLTPGSSLTYSVGFTAPAGYTATTPLSGTGNQLVSFTLGAGEYNQTQDAGFRLVPVAPVYDLALAKNVVGSGPFLPGSQASYVLTVTNNSTVPVYNVRVDDVLPAGLSFVSGTGFAVSGANSVSASVAGPISASGGVVSLSLVVAISPAYSSPMATNQGLISAFTATPDPAGAIPVDIRPANNTATVGIPIGSLAAVGDFVYNDLNGNGVADPGEPGLAGVTVSLYQNGSAVTSVLTDATGLYSFTGLTPGSSLTYSVGFTAPAGYTATTPLSGTGNQLVSFTLGAGEYNQTQDAGFRLVPVATATLGDNVFADTNSNGLRDGGEAGVAGVMVTLYVSTTAGPTLVTSTTTTTSGLYSFTGLTPGVPYYVVFNPATLPAGFTLTAPLSGTDRTIDSDADPVTGQTASLTLAPGETNTSVDAGVRGAPTGTPAIMLSITDPATCNPLTNVYSTTGVVNLTNAPTGTLTITDNGIVALTFSVTAGQASVGFSLTGISGTPPATHTLVATLTTLTSSATYAVPPSCTACSAIALTPTLGNGQVGAAYSQTITASGGVAPYTYVVSAGSLPTGLNLNTATGVLSGTPASATVVAFTIVVTDSKSCTGTAPYSLTIGSNCPTNFSLVASNDASICPGESIQLTASTPIPGAQIRWYLTPTDGASFTTVASGAPITVQPTMTTTYYAEVVTVDGCVSTREPVSVTVTTVATPVIAGNARNTCPATTVDLTAIQITNQTSGLTYEWYTSAVRSQTALVTSLTAVGAGQYYLFAKTASGCYSTPAVLTAEIINCNCQNIAGVTVGPGVAVCSGDLIPLRAVLSGSATSVVWSSGGTGTFSNPNSLSTTYTPSAADITSGSVLLTATTNDPDGAGVCTVATSSLLATINRRPDAPVGVACDDTLVCQGSSTKLIGFAPGNRINWYDQTNTLVGTTESGGKLVVTPSQAGAIVYTAEAVSAANCVSSRTSLTITVGTCLADLAVVKRVVTAGPYSIGQRITYAVTASNNGPITGTAVNVTDLLPTQLTYVSSTPAGEYNPATGVWTIGTLTTGSNRNLLIEATINAVGSIQNTATVSGTNNDPNLARNDVSSVTIQTILCDVKPPLVTCAITEICTGGSTTLQATGCTDGTIRWSDGQSGVTVSVSPTITTTYSASCAVGNCTSGASNPITVTVLDPPTPVITASADRVCPGTSVTLTASGCTGGTILWSENGQTGTSIVVSPLTRTTYTAQCRVGSCLSKPATKTIDMASELPTPTIICSTSVVCPGETVTLSVSNCVGSPVWSSTTETTGSIIVTPTAGNNTYSVYCKNGACSSKSSPVYTIEIIAPVIPTVTASADSVCAGGLVSLTATGCNGMVVWNVAGKTGPVISVNPNTSISYYAQCRYRTCLSDPSNSVPVTVLTPSAPIITATKTLICSGDAVTLTAEGCEGTVKWYGIDRIGASIEILPTETKEYYATCKQGSCESDASNRIRITVNTSATAAPVIAASTTAVCSGGVVSLTATGCVGGSIIWSVPGLTGPVVSVTATPANNEFYAVCRVGTQCGSTRSNTIRVNVTPVPTPTVTCSTDSTCPGERVTLTVNNCQGTPYWSTGATTPSIFVTPAVTTTYTVYCRDGVCRSDVSKDYTITVTPVAAPTIVASATAVEPGGTISLTATGCAGQVIWSANDINGNNVGATLVFRPEGSQTYYAQCRFRECLSEPSNTITVNRSGDCIVKAGTLAPASATVCADTSLLTKISAVPNGGLIQPAGYSVVYVLTKGANLVIQQTSTTPTFSVPSETSTYTIHTLVYNATPTDPNYLDLSAVKPGITTGTDVLRLIAEKKICAELDATGAKVNVRFVAPPVLHTSSLTVCAGATVTLTATGCEGGTVNWSDGSVGQTISKVVLSDIWLMATCTIDGCTSKMSHSIDVVLGTPGIPTIAVDRPVVCTGETATLTATGCEGGSYIWSDGVTVGNTLTVTPTADASYRVRCKVGSCEGEWSPFTTIKVGTPVAPTVSVAGGATSTTACFGAPVTLVAQGCPANSYVTWSNDLVGATITVSLARSVTYTARCCASTSCKSVPSNPVTITVLPKVSYPVTIDRTNACPFNTVDLSTGVTSRTSTLGGVFEYYTSASLSPESKVADPAAVGSGTYYVVEKTINGCYSLPAVIHVLINACGAPVACDPRNPATASAGADATICAAKTYQLSGVIGGAGTVAHWTTSGNGTFDNPYAVNAVYSATAEDLLAGKVTLTLSVSTNNAACPVAKDDLLLTIDGSKSIPTVKVVGATNFCYGDSVTLEAPAGATYLWSNKASTQRIVVKNSGAYSVQLLDQKGCSSIKSEEVVVTVSKPTATPLVANLRNTCPAIVANLTSALSATTAGTTYEYRIGTSVSSSQVMRPDSVGAGTYYVFGKTAAGCTSAPAKVVVSIFNCAADSLTTDVSITKTASAATVKNGEPVTYTIKVRNNGVHTAKNIDVRDVLPAGVELIPATTTDYIVSNGVITKRIDSLVAGQSDSIVFAVRVLEKGEIVNKAEITYLDQQDTNLANNSSSVTVTDTSAATAKPSLIGLAKSVLGVPTAVGDSLIRVSYNFVMTNFGDDTLRNIQVVDDLAYFFVPSTVTAATVTLKNAGSTLKVHPGFTGRGNDTNLLDSTSYLAPGRSQTIRLDVTVRRAASDTRDVFRNIASVTAQNSLTTVSDLSTSGGDPDPDGDGDPTNNTDITSFTLGVGQPEESGIGLALAVVKVEQQADSSYNVTYKATIRNFSNVDLLGVSLTDSLVKAFTSPTSYSVVGPPVVGVGSTLVVNNNYDGNTQSDMLIGSSSLAAGVQDTVLITVNVRLNGNQGPFYTSATVTAQPADSSQAVTDISNSGFDPSPAGSVATGVRFDLPKGLLGVAKAVGAPTLVAEGIYDVPYTITLTNLGTVPLKKVQVADNLSETFNHGALVVSNRIAVASDAGLTVDTLYTGQGLVTNMLVDSLSNLPVGASRKLTFTVRVDVKNADSLVFYNTARATALTTDNEVVMDMSTAGTNNDPDNDLDPRNNSEPTPISLNNLATTPYIGVAMAIRDTVRQANGSYDVVYQIVVQNFGTEPLTKVVLRDSLSNVFNSTTGATYTVVQAPIITSTGSALKLNPNFNGSSDPLIVLGDSASSLAVGKVDTILVTVNVFTDGSTTTFLNTVYAEALARTVTVTDISTNGLIPDLNGNGNPTDENEREATPLTLLPSSSAIFIPQGFSPNGDGINDLFVIRGTQGITVSLEVYNRWGNLVYKNDDYQNNWDGKANTGITVGSDANGLPDGTYYYVIKTSDGRKFVRYMTINR